MTLQRRLCASSVLVPPDLDSRTLWTGLKAASQLLRTSNGFRAPAKCWYSAMSIGHVSNSELVDRVMPFCLNEVFRLVFRRLLCLRSDAAATMAALPGVTPLFDVREFDRSISMPSRFSIGPSNRAAFGRLSSPLANVNDALRLGGWSSSDSSPLVSLSNNPGYLS